MILDLYGKAGNSHRLEDVLFQLLVNTHPMLPAWMRVELANEWNSYKEWCAHLNVGVPMTISFFFMPSEAVV